jgi:hypothetical protein
MLSWIVRLLMIAAGLVTSWFVAKDAPIFGIAQVMMTLVLISLSLLSWPSGHNVGRQPSTVFIVSGESAGAAYL